jgi:hypothetical protein
MSTHNPVSGLSYFCTDGKLRQAFALPRSSSRQKEPQL